MAEVAGLLTARLPPRTWRGGLRGHGPRMTPGVANAQTSTMNVCLPPILGRINPLVEPIAREFSAGRGNRPWYRHPSSGQFATCLPSSSYRPSSVDPGTAHLASAGFPPPKRRFVAESIPLAPGLRARGLQSGNTIVSTYRTRTTQVAICLISAAVRGGESRFATIGASWSAARRPRQF
jgi:hypothetical protein